MKNPIVELVEKELVWFNTVWNQDRNRTPHLQIFPEKDNLYPIPFFGDIRRSEVLTLGLNPAHTEFNDDRFWLPNRHPTQLTAPALSTRLVKYFDLPEPMQHSWFDDLEKALLYIGSSYNQNAAHLDLLSHPTKWPARLGIQLANTFAMLLDEHDELVDSVLSLVRPPKLLLVVNYRLRGNNHDGLRVWDKFCQKIVTAGGQQDFDGQSAPVLIRDNPKALAEAVYQKRRELRTYLSDGPQLTFRGHD